MQDALKFPLIGSAVLVGLFALFKLLPKDIVNAVLTAYFVLLGTFAVTAAMLPIIEGMLPRKWQGQAFSLKGVTIPVVLKVSKQSLYACHACISCWQVHSFHSMHMYLCTISSAFVPSGAQLLAALGYNLASTSHCECRTAVPAGTNRHRSNIHRAHWGPTQPDILLLVLC